MFILKGKGEILKVQVTDMSMFFSTKIKSNEKYGLNYLACDKRCLDITLHSKRNVVCSFEAPLFNF